MESQKPLNSEDLDTESLNPEKRREKAAIQVIRDPERRSRAKLTAEQLDGSETELRHRESASDLMLLTSLMTGLLDMNHHTMEEIRKELMKQMSEEFDTQLDLHKTYYN